MGKGRRGIDTRNRSKETHTPGLIGLLMRQAAIALGRKEAGGRVSSPSGQQKTPQG